MNARETSPERILQLGFAYRAAKALLSAVELDVFSMLADGPLDGEVLRHRLGLHERGAFDFLDALVALRLLDRQGDGRYANTPEADRYLDRRKPTYVGGLLEMWNARSYGLWGSLTEALRTGQPQNEVKEGGDVFRRLYQDPAALQRFLGAMTGLSLPPATALATWPGWRACRSFVDVGTAEGALPTLIAEAHPHLAGTGFDLPPVRPAFERHVAAHRLEDRLRFVAGDFLADPLPTADVLVLGHILHDWDLATKRLLLRKAHAALPPGGTLLVYDQMIDDARRENASGLLMSLNMLLETAGGFDYTQAACLEWLREAGFGEASVEHLWGPYALARATKPLAS
jgi:hypothetical protein